MNSIVIRNAVLPFLVAFIFYRSASGQQYATARYNSSDGALYIYSTASIGTIGFETAGLFNTSLGKPFMGPDQGANIFSSEAMAFINSNGLPSGLFSIGRFLPPSLSPSEIAFGYFPLAGGDASGFVESFPATPTASAEYNSATGAVIVNVNPAAQALLLESAGLFNTGLLPTLGGISPSQFDAKNLMFFNNDAPLPAGTFNLGAVLPPGLSASQISLATKGNGIAVGIPVTVVPEPGAVALAAIGLSLAACRIPRAAM